MGAELAWWDTSWNYRQELTFDNGEQSENLIDFPVLVKLTSSNFDFSKAQSGGDDIRFIDSDDTTELKFHWESYDSIAQEAYGWVKVPQIDGSSSEDFIYMYYGNKEASNVEDEEGTYDLNFVMVQHMSDETSTTIRDSTINDNDGNKWEAYGPIETTDGKIGYAQEFDGDDDHIIAPRSFDFDVLTVEAWIKRDVIDADHTIFGYGDALIYYGWSFLVGANNYLRFVAVTYNGNINFDVPGSTTTIDSDKWYYVTAVCEGADVGDDGIIYINGGEEARADQEKSMEWGTILPKIGQWGTIQLQHRFDGIIDEVRISDIARSPDWIKACYKSESDNFITFGHNTVFLYDKAWVDDDAESGWYDSTHFLTIQEGIDAVVDGGIVHVFAGIYNEAILIDRQLTLLGAQYDVDPTVEGVRIDELESVIDAGGLSAVITITADLVSVNGFTITNGGGAAPSHLRGGVCLIGTLVSGCTISNNKIVENLRDGIDSCSSGSGVNVFENNVISNNGYGAVYLGGNKGGDIVRNNVISDNGDRGGTGQIGIQSSDNIIEGNTINGDTTYYPYGAGILIMGSHVDIRKNNILRGNIMNRGESGPGFWYGIGIAYAENTLMENNIIHNNLGGIGVFQSTYTTSLRGNDVQWNEWGIKVGSSSGDTENTIIKYNVVLNNDKGIIIRGAASITNINLNTIVDNIGYGVLNEISTPVDATLNWWGTMVGDEIAGKVTENVEFEPWTEPIWYGDITGYMDEIVLGNQETYKIDARTMADTEVYITAVSGMTVAIVAKYKANPGTNLDNDLGTYIDVYLSDVSGVNKVEIRTYYTDNDWNGREVMYYLNGTEWYECSSTGMGTNVDEKYVWAIIDGSTDPSLTYLFGGPFGSGVGAEVASQFDNVRDVWGSMFQLIVLMAALGLVDSLLRGEPGNWGILQTVITLVAGTAALMILLQVVENIG